MSDSLPIDEPQTEPLDKAEARTIIERLVPDQTLRNRFLSILVDSIFAAHAAGPKKWYLRIQSDRVWLNVGRIVVCGIERNNLWIAFDSRLLKEDELGKPDALTFDSWKTLPHAVTVRFDTLSDLEAFPTYQEAHLALIQELIEATNHIGIVRAQAHSYGAIAYLRETINPKVPNPSLTNQLPRVERQKIEQAFRDFDTHKRGRSYWINWEIDPTYRYAVQWENRLYPVNEIVKMATGEEYIHSKQARTYLQSYGFSIIQKHNKASKSQHDLNILQLLQQQFTSRGLHFTEWQIATFYTALQTKGFVILSGISGTGKTKLAQHFAELLPQPSAAPEPLEREDERIVITLKPYMFKASRIILPKQATRFFDPPKPGETKHVVVTIHEQNHNCWLTHAQFNGTDHVTLVLRDSVNKWLKLNFKPGDTITLEPEYTTKQELMGFRMTDARTTEQPAPADGQGANWLFITVRPDWRDSKSLLGYFDPLTGTYVWTDFLRFLVRAAQSYQNKEDVAWFVILDEMNLAPVEYYFADLLSVLESGRTSDGWSREALRFDYPTNSDGDLPPRELRLPPNLAFIGTVNVDETSHAFSRKVLDRAFTIEFAETDFTTYPPLEIRAAPKLTPQIRQQLLQQYSQQGRYPRVQKERIAAYVATHPNIRAYLRSLNAQLQPYNMHFGFRVFDEIVAFLDAADENEMFDEFSEPLSAFDAAVLMKVLPKFHGSRGKLEAPLRAVLAWCIDPNSPQTASLDEALNKCSSAQEMMGVLDSYDYRFEYTAKRAARIMWSLYTDGFASFG